MEAAIDENDVDIKDSILLKDGSIIIGSDEEPVNQPEEIMTSAERKSDVVCMKIGRSTIIKQTPNLKLQPLKTKLFKYDNEVLLNCNSKIFPTLNDSKNELEYLGFSFNGKKVSLRSKTISKFYYRAYHRVDNLILRENGIVNKKPDYYTLYKNYTHLGKSTKGKNRGNFLTYVDRCIEVFGEQEMVSQVRKRHWKRINDRIKKSINNSKCAS